MAGSNGLAGAAQRLVLVCNGDDSSLALETTQEPLKPPPSAPEEPPLVFICAQCKRVLGDSTGWVQTDLEENSLLLRVVSSFVKDEEQQFSKIPQDNCCLIKALICSGCSTCVGKIYKSTPRHLDFKRDLFCLNINAIESYALGSTPLQEIAETDEPITLEKRSELEAELDKAKAVLKVLQDQIATLQAKIT